MSALNKFLEWVTKLAYLNVLWLLFSILGLLIIGLFPSTTATFVVAREWVTGKTDIPVFKTFWDAYRKEMIKSNILGYLLIIVSYILYLDFFFITESMNDYVVLLTIPYLIVSFIVVLSMLYVFPTYVYYQMRIRQVIKNSFFIMIMNPMPTLVMVLGCFAVCLVLWKFQGLFLFFSASIFAVITMLPAHRAFTNISNKKVKFEGFRG
ncbi:hypothetical protein CR203_22640 [Salipaludibacillus neizhouensis]|uniref:DUF624 domain-containing protein n=1 Tax=Salipaludibacillus neizhouensis TaxID=885475 RepID=A0A3A9K1E6_9BACI|nr:YesL family protein [Salipaludibacillus neizhouensis]RKL65068.1 hypothetical protein CR203_22640 [Salipaludibacillus neizhouensis]